MEAPIPPALSLNSLQQDSIQLNKQALKFSTMIKASKLIRRQKYQLNDHLRPGPKTY